MIPPLPIENTVKIVCPQCNGSGDPCRGWSSDDPGIDCEPSYCKGAKWIWATRWEDR